jgi:hypothetical protein
MANPGENLPSGIQPSPGTPRSGETLFEWPHCPNCGTPRSTKCPACENEGAAWEQAFGPPAAHFEGRGGIVDSESRRFAVICPTCDEVFVPKFARRCGDCGYRFAGENELTTAGRIAADDESPRRPRSDVRHTARIVLTIVTAAAVLYTLYDWLLSNSGGPRLFP